MKTNEQMNEAGKSQDQPTNGQSVYDIQSLIDINYSYHFEHGITESDVQMVNNYVDHIRKTRSKIIPKPGDRILYTCEHGIYNSRAIIEGRKTNHGISICREPMIPFISEKEDGIYCCISGGPFTFVPQNKLVYKGTAKNYFKDWGHYGACGNGAVCFEAEVSIWEYAEPEPLYGDFTTKDWRKLYVHHHIDHQCDYLYTSNGFAFKTEEEYQSFLKKYKATVFPGNWQTQIVLWCYNDQFEATSFENWEKLDAPISYEKRFRQNTPLKGVYDDDTHTLIFYYVKDNGSTDQ